MRDVELDRLKEAMDSAFKNKQSAYDAQQEAWARRSAARDVMNSAYESKQRAYEAQQDAWERYRTTKNSNGPRIDSLNAQQERAYQNMKNGSDRKSVV